VLLYNTHPRWELDCKIDSLFPQILGFRVLLVLQTLPLVYLAFEVRVSSLEFGVGVLKLFLLALNTIEPQKLTFEGGFRVASSALRFLTSSLDRETSSF